MYLFNSNCKATIVITKGKPKLGYHLNLNIEFVDSEDKIATLKFDSFADDGDYEVFFLFHQKYYFDTEETTSHKITLKNSIE